MQKLLLNDLQDLHGASLGADTAGDTLACSATFRKDNDLGRTSLSTLAAGCTQLLVDHIYTGLGILGDRTAFTSLHTQTALNADHGLRTVLALHDMDAGKIGMECLIESLGAGFNASQASHTFHIFLNSQLFHNGGFSFVFLVPVYYTATIKK